MFDLSIIILNHNAGNFLNDCLDSISIADKKKLKLEIIVADNASSDNSLQALKPHPEVQLINNHGNIGFAAGNNRAVVKSSGRYLLFLNPDTVIEKDTLLKMVQFMESTPSAGAATCQVNFKNGNLDESCHRGFPTPWNSFCHFSGLEKVFPKSRLFSGYNLGYLDKNTVHEIDAGCGAFLIVRREAGESINWWDEDYFFYGEDLDFCFSLKEKGWKIYYYPFVKIIHYKGISSGIIKRSQTISTSNITTRTTAAKASTEAMRIFYNKHYIKKYPRLLNSVVMFGINFLENRRLAKIQ